MEEYARVAGGAVLPNGPRECDHVIKQGIEVNRPYLGCGVADLVAQVFDEKTQALVERALFEQALPAQRIVHER